MATKVEITEQAERNLNNMHARVFQIGDTYGFSSKEYRTASESLIHSLLQVFRLGGEVFAEDDLSLYCVSFIDYGVVFHRNRTPFTNAFGEEIEGVAGEWSVHS